nr:TerB family tellurite resistance protein [Pseudomonas sp. MWU16-30317]
MSDSPMSNACWPSANNVLWPTTLIGAGAGYAIASIPGAMLGALLGQALDRRLQLHSWANVRELLGGRPALRDDELLFVLLGRVAKSDGVVTDSHIRQARHEMAQLHLGPGAQQAAIASFGRGKTGRDNVRGHLRRLGRQAHTGEGILRACWRMAWADGGVGATERELILQWSGWLGWTRQQSLALGADYEPRRNKPPVNSGGEYQDALRLLGVNSATEPDQIKRAYRRLLSKHHPDKLEGSGANEAQVRAATERTRDLHNAYTLIRQRRDF